MILPALLALCGCSEKMFPIRGASKINTTQVEGAEPVQVVAQDTMPIEEEIIPKEEVKTEKIVVERAPIPEEWTTIKDDSPVVIESMSGKFDISPDSWYAKTFFVDNDVCISTKGNPEYSDSVYIERLANIPCVVPMVYNQLVRDNIDRYAKQGRRQIAYMLGMMEHYEPLIEHTLDVFGIPNELKYLPIVESAFNPTAVSYVGATGLWQFMYNTGKSLGLRQNSLVDERRDPVRSTWAAAKYLRMLYDRFGDWSLAIAAYNCGPGNVSKAIYRSEGKTDFWDIYWLLPSETRGYLPAFIAATYIMTYHAEHGICPVDSKLPIVTDTVRINRLLHFEQIAAVCDIDIETLRGLNPQFKEDIIPGKFHPETLRLPEDKIRDFILSGDSIYNYERNKYFSEDIVKKVKEQIQNQESAKWIIHKIRQGESLSVIAHRYRVKIADIKRWNNLKSNNISAGKTLKIYSK